MTDINYGKCYPFYRSVRIGRRDGAAETSDCHSIATGLIHHPLIFVLSKKQDYGCRIFYEAGQTVAGCHSHDLDSRTLSGLLGIQSVLFRALRAGQ